MWNMLREKGRNNSKISMLLEQTQENSVTFIPVSFPSRLPHICQTTYLSRVEGYTNVQLSSSCIERCSLSTIGDKSARALISHRVLAEANHSKPAQSSSIYIQSTSQAIDTTKMLPLRRPASRILPLLSRPSHRRRINTEEVTGPQNTSSGHFDSAGQHAPTSHAPHPEPVNESLGRGFYFALAVLPLSFALYKFSRSSDDPASQPWLTRVIGSYDHWRDEWTRRNTLHTAMIEQAAHDRHLFQGSPGSKVIELRFPELVSPSSPSPYSHFPSLPLYSHPSTPSPSPTPYTNLHLLTKPPNTQGLLNRLPLQHPRRLASQSR